MFGPAADRLPPAELLALVRHLPDDSALARDLLGPRAAWRVDTVLLARIAYLLDGANWQRSGGTGMRPRPLRPPEPRPRHRRREGADAARRLRNLGLLPGHPPQGDGQLDPVERQLAAQLETPARRRT